MEYADEGCGTGEGPEMQNQVFSFSKSRGVDMDTFPKPVELIVKEEKAKKWRQLTQAQIPIHMLGGGETMLGTSSPNVSSPLY